MNDWNQFDLEPVFGDVLAAVIDTPLIIGILMLQILQLF